MDKNKRNSIIGIVVGAITFAATSFLVKNYLFKEPTFDKILMETASELNKTCPIMVDSETRLDNAIALPENKFQYNYTLVNLSADQIDTIEAHKLLDEGIINNVKTNPDLKTFREKKVTMGYYYKDKDGKYLMKLNVTPDLYGGND